MTGFERLAVFEHSSRGEVFIVLRKASHGCRFCDHHAGLACPMKKFSGASGQHVATRPSGSYGLAMRLVTGCLLFLSACPPRSPTPTPLDAGAFLARKLDVVVFGNDHGRFVTDGPRLIEQWRTQAGWPEALVLSIGGSPSRAAEWSSFRWQPAGDLYRAANVAAFTAGPADVDFGVEALADAQRRSGATLLLANVQSDALQAPTFAVFERQRVSIAVVGLSTLTAQDGAFRVLPLEGALLTAVTSATQQGAKVTVVLVSGCSGPVREVLQRNPDLHVNLVVAKACPDTADARVGQAFLLHLPEGLGRSVRLHVEVGATVVSSAQLVEAPTSGPEETNAASARDGWLQKVAVEREQLVASLPRQLEKADVARLTALALKEVAGVDAALFQTRTVRAGLPKGPVTRGQVFDALPDAERVLLVDVPGEVLTLLTSHPDAFLSTPPKLSANGDYVLAMSEDAFRVGVGLEAIDANPQVSPLRVPEVLLQWLERHPSTAQRPLVLPAKTSKR